MLETVHRAATLVHQQETATLVVVVDADTEARRPHKKKAKRKHRRTGQSPEAARAKRIRNLGKPWKPGQSGNPLGSALRRPLVEQTVAWYRDQPERLLELVELMHDGAMGRREISMVQVAAFSAIQKVVDQMHRRSDGLDKAAVPDSITLIIPEDRRVEHAGVTLTVEAKSAPAVGPGDATPVFELPVDPEDPRAIPA